MQRKPAWKPLLIALAIPLAVGGLGALISGDGMEKYRALRQPPLAPPDWAFPVAWTALYLLMGVSSYLAYRATEPGPRRQGAAILYGAQLAANLLWTLFYFALGWRMFAFWWLLLLLALAAGMVYAFARISRAAAWLQAPYLLWLLFAAYLNWGVWMLN